MKSDRKCMRFCGTGGIFIAALAAIAINGCTTLREAMMLLEPTKVFDYMLCAGMLPHLSTNQVETFFTYIDPPGSSLKYPVGVQVVVDVKGQKQKAYYRLEEAAKGKPWIIVSAWTFGANRERIDLALPSLEDQLRANALISNEGRSQSTDRGRVSTNRTDRGRVSTNN